jgi:hypothetical protein
METDGFGLVKPELRPGGPENIVSFVNVVMVFN